MVMRCRLSARGLTDRTLPTSVTMPVNMSRTLKHLERIGSKLFAAARVQLSGESVERHSLQRRDAAGADALLAAQDCHLIDKIGCSESAGHLRAALYHQPGDALLGQNLQHLIEIEPALHVADAEHLAAFLLQDFLGDGRRLA